MPRKNWMISDLILPPEKVSRMFPSIKSDCLKYLQQCLIRINSYSQSSISKKKKRARPLWFNFNLYGKPAWRNINLIVDTFAIKLELIAEEQCNGWNSFLLCWTAFNVVPKLWVACDSLQLKYLAQHCVNLFLLLQRDAFVFYWLANYFHSLDTPEGVAQELVSAGLISGQDLVVGKECFLKTYLPTLHPEVI